MKAIGFIGTGNMGGALAACVGASKKYNVLLCDRDTEKARALAERIGGEVTDALDLCARCDYVFIGVKPNAVGAVAAEIRDALKKSGAVAVSMAAGVSLAMLEGYLGAEAPIIRIMPNTPCSIGEGVILVCPNAAADGAATDEFISALSGAGLVDRIEEKFIDAAAAVSGCGPAFVYMFTEALADGAVACGLPREKALLYAAATARGAAQMIISTGKHPELLKDEVCSPGGTTIEGVGALERGAMRGVVSSAVVAAFEKTKLLAK